MNKLVAAAKTDLAAEREGAWFEYCPDGVNTFRIKMARAGTNNPAFMKLQTDLLKPYRMAQRPGQTNLNIPYEKDREISRKLYSQTVVMDWNADDFGIQFSKDECYKMFQEANDILDWCMNTAQGADNFREVAVTENAGN